MTIHHDHQHYPDATVWGPMHWGHATSEDLLHWKHKPIALYPGILNIIIIISIIIIIVLVLMFSPISSIYPLFKYLGATKAIFWQF